MTCCCNFQILDHLIFVWGYGRNVLLNIQMLMRFSANPENEFYRVAIRCLCATKTENRKVLSLLYFFFLLVMACYCFKEVPRQHTFLKIRSYCFFLVVKIVHFVFRHTAITWRSQFCWSFNFVLLLCFFVFSFMCVFLSHVTEVVWTAPRHF